MGLPLYFIPSSPFAVVNDPALVSMIHDAGATLNATDRRTMYESIWKYISDKAYAPFLYDTPFYNLSLSSVSVPGLTTYGYQALWQYATVR